MSRSVPPEPSGHDADAERKNPRQLYREIGVKPWIAEGVTDLARDSRNREAPHHEQEGEDRGRSPASVKASDRPSDRERTRQREQHVRCSAQQRKVVLKANRKHRTPKWSTDLTP